MNIITYIKNRMQRYITCDFFFTKLHKEIHSILHLQITEPISFENTLQYIL